MEKRNFERIAVNVEARFFQWKMFYSGTVLDLSAKGMFIKTNPCLLYNSKLIVFLLAEKNLLKVPVRVKRVSTINHHCDGIGVEILNSTEDYTKFVLNTRTNLLIE